jgi:zinc/manganese transport system substrate-binding protein
MNTNRRHLLANACALALLSPLGTSAADQIKVTASFSILGDLVQAVGGPRVALTTLVGPDQDAHGFEPQAAQTKALLQSELLVTNGLDFEPWIHKFAKAAGFKGKTLVASKGIKPLHVGNETDPHAWQNPRNTMVYVQNIANSLGQLDPAGADLYQANANAYLQKLLALDLWAQEQLASIPAAKRKVICSHDAFGYLGAHYKITFLAPQGVSTEAEPSARQVALLIRQIKHEKIKAVFVENMASPKLLTQLSRDAGVSVGADLYSDALSGPDKPGATYLQMMRHNVTQLAAGMRLN